jgi:hypothetical protein
MGKLVDEIINLVSALAARTKKSKLEVLDDLTTRSIDVYKRIIGILEVHAEACNASKAFIAEYMLFHILSPRYQTEELGLKLIGLRLYLTKCPLSYTIYTT